MRYRDFVIQKLGQYFKALLDPSWIILFHVVQNSAVQSILKLKLKYDTPLNILHHETLNKLTLLTVSNRLFELSERCDKTGLNESDPTFNVLFDHKHHNFNFQSRRTKKKNLGSFISALIICHDFEFYLNISKYSKLIVLLKMNSKYKFEYKNSKFLTSKFDLSILESHPIPRLNNHFPYTGLFLNSLKNFKVSSSYIEEWDSLNLALIFFKCQFFVYLCTFIFSSLCFGSITFHFLDKNWSTRAYDFFLFLCQLIKNFISYSSALIKKE
ncbi:hypothetical protein BpHYR1_007269 [Brachionus plicatilis]|uniref:Uncharacterized protein n=1 Tax=Brachionus plicatilis TaxID=10195 RepID=A0A3M7PK62_BRAPC|nr:hypothetical protein BpHYR1_007269 [Brachionus plicatilis]